MPHKEKKLPPALSATIADPIISRRSWRTWGSWRRTGSSSPVGSRASVSAPWIVPGVVPFRHRRGLKNSLTRSVRPGQSSGSLADTGRLPKGLSPRDLQGHHHDRQVDARRAEEVRSKERRLELIGNALSPSSCNSPASLRPFRSLTSDLCPLSPAPCSLLPASGPVATERAEVETRAGAAIARRQNDCEAGGGRHSQSFVGSWWKGRFLHSARMPHDSGDASPSLDI